MFQVVSLEVLMFCCMVSALAGLIKGVVGFALPLITLSGVSLVAPPDIALAALILPTLVANVWQAARQGRKAAIETIWDFRRFLLIMLVCLAISAQFVTFLSPSMFYLVIGVLVTGFTLLHMLRPKLVVSQRRRGALEVGFGVAAGVSGGVSGIWGPPTVMFLTATGTDKSAQMRVQGVVYGVGSIALVIAHFRSGILNSATLPLSALLVLPALAGLWLGFKLHDRLDQKLFLRATMMILIITGLNLIRKGLLA